MCMSFRTLICTPTPGNCQQLSYDFICYFHLMQVTEQDLLQMPKGQRSLEGLRLNTRVGVQYLAAWMTGTGSVPLYNLMEDAATAEISRVQNWQWIKYNAVLDGGLVAGNFYLYPLRLTGVIGFDALEISRQGTRMFRNWS